MIRLALTVAMLALVGLLSIAATPAAAEFKAKSTEGSGDFQIVIGGVGATIDCGSTETSQLGWQIKKEGKATTSGSELALKFKSWGKCAVEAKEGKEATLSGGECTWEAREPGSEREVAARIVSACKLKGESGGKACEVTLEPKTNEKLNSLTLIDSGEANENLAVNLALKNVNVTAVGAGCEVAGIKSTTAGEITGAIEALNVAAGVPAPVFRVYYVTSNSMTAIGQTRTVGVLNTGPMAAPGMKLLEAGNSPWFTIANETVATCQGRVLNTNASCQMTVEFSMASSNVKRLLIQIWEGGVIVSEVPILAVS